MDSQVAICQRTIEAAEHLLNFDLSVIGMQDNGRLHPKAVSSGLSPDEFDTMSIDEGLAGKTFRTKEAYLIDDITTWDEAKPQGRWTSGLSIPVGDHGNFQAVDSRREAFDEQDFQLAKLLTTHASNHLDRLVKRQELERQNDRLDEFASIVSHDLRNPLNVAELRLELIRDEYESDHLDEIETAHERMEALIEDLLTLAREGNAASDYEPVELADVATNAWTTVDTTAATLVTDTDLRLTANESSLQRLFENLFRNAVEHNDEQITVTIGILANGFYVEDDGSGIPKDKRTTVFDTDYSTARDGTGLGLRIVAQVVDNHDWQIHVTDGADGGARFEITGVDFVGDE
jgi:signal transduction histidine kinase